MDKQISDNYVAAIENRLDVPEDDDVFVFPASFAQQRLWFFNQLEEEIAIYNVPAAVQLTGMLYVNALKQALAEIVRRHEVLRTTFKMFEGSLVQVIAPKQTLVLPMIDLQSLSSQERSQKVQQLANEAAQRPFDLAKGPLLRVTLLQLGAEDHVLLVTMHHIISDGWSVGVFIRELGALYTAFCQGMPSPLPELPIQYADFTDWQREWLNDEVLQTQVDYWQQQLIGAPPLLELPTDHPRPAVQTFFGGIECFELQAQLKQQLKALGQNSGVTLFMTLLGVFVTLLARYSGQEDIVVGSPIANRKRPEIEPLIGFFVNTLVLRTQLQGNPTFLELLEQVKKVALDAYTYQDLPFEQLVEILQPERSLSYSPLFQVMFVLQNAPFQELQLPGLTLTYLEVENVTAKFDLTLTMSETEQGLVGTWEYNKDLFDSATIRRMSQHFQTLLSEIVTNPQQRIGEIPLLTKAERHQLLVEWNQTPIEPSLDQCIHQMFAVQVERTPEAIAVVFEDEQLTYRELNCRANQLAHHLQSLGVGPDVLVGICLERSVEMLVAVLGILKAGGAYVPLDPAYPQERLAYMLEDTHVPVLVTQEHLQTNFLKAAKAPQIVCLDSQWDVIQTQPDTNPDAPVLPEHLVYVIYTSGSTGQPKGVSLPHRALSNLLQWHLATLKPGVGVLQFASLSFDASIHEMFAAWCSGGTLFMIPESLRLDLESLIQFLANKPIQKVILPVVVLQQLAEAYGHQPHLFYNLTEIITTGEQLQINRPIVHLFNQLTDYSLHNHYGPSETHVVTAYTFSGTPNEWPAYPPIGKPISHTQIYIVDNYFQPVPIGVTGELYIGGAGLAKGYFNRPELTNQKFIPNPFSNQADDYLYKTGDLARYLPDGNIEFLGRIDHQVKIRGFRVELGEVEAVLNQHPQINQAIVIVKGKKAGEKRLVAYVVPVQKETISILELRQFLQQQLPAYMIPSAFVRLEALPLTPNKKVDRSALPEPDESSYVLSETFVAPRTPTEEVLAQMWIELLSIEKIGVYDNFFYLGGHSLLATQLISRIRQFFYLEIPLRSLFESPTIADLVEVMARSAGGREVVDEIAIALKEINQLSPEELKAALAELKENS